MKKNIMNKKKTADKYEAKDPYWNKTKNMCKYKDIHIYDRSKRLCVLCIPFMLLDSSSPDIIIVSCELFGSIRIKYAY